MDPVGVSVQQGLSRVLCLSRSVMIPIIFVFCSQTMPIDKHINVVHLCYIHVKWYPCRTSSVFEKLILYSLKQELRTVCSLNYLISPSFFSAFHPPIWFRGRPLYMGTGIRFVYRNNTSFGFGNNTFILKYLNKPNTYFFHFIELIDRAPVLFIPTKLDWLFV